MFGLGTIINCLGIVAGGLVGLICGKMIKPHYQETLIAVCGFSTAMIGIAGVLQKMLVITPEGIETTGTLVMVASLAIGAVIGEMLGLEHIIERFGEWLKVKSNSTKDAGFVEGFVTASLTVCIGAMAIVGAIEDGIYANHSILFAKSVLDMVIVAVMAASLGKGCLFSAIPVGILQGSVTVLAVFIKPFLTDAALNNLSLVGSVMIICVGANLIFGKLVRVANLLPGLIVAVVWAVIA